MEYILIFSSVILMFLLMTSLVSYLITIYPLYKMYEKANLKKPWIAFIPCINSIKIFNLANMSMWVYLFTILLAFIPFAGSITVLIINCYINYKTAKNFGLGSLGCILALFFGIFVFWYIAITNKDFIGEINPNYTEVAE